MFGVDSLSRFPFRMRTHTHTLTETQSQKPLITYHTHALATAGMGDYRSRSAVYNLNWWLPGKFCRLLNEFLGRITINRYSHFRLISLDGCRVTLTANNVGSRGYTGQHTTPQDTDGRHYNEGPSCRLPRHESRHVGPTFIWSDRAGS